MVIFLFFINRLRTDNGTKSLKHYVQIDQLRKIKRTTGRLKRKTLILQKKSQKNPCVQVKQKNATKLKTLLKNLILSYIM